MRTRTERQSRVEHHVDGILVRNVTPAGTNPQTLAKTHRMEIIHPFAFPVFIFQLFDFMGKSGTQQRMLLQNRDNVFHVGFGVEQTDHIGIAPQTGFARQRLKNRRIVRILKGNGNGARFHQRITQLFSIRAGGIQFQLDPWHGKTLYLSVDNTVACEAEEPNRFPIRKANKLNSNAGTIG